MPYIIAVVGIYVVLRFIPYIIAVVGIYGSRYPNNGYENTPRVYLHSQKNIQ